jgi:cytochrome oxidase Cu insertion factor (SCO1/SenC/PrrC family)
MRAGASIASALFAFALGSGGAAAHDIAAHLPSLEAATPSGSHALPPTIPGIGGPFHLVDQTGAPRSDNDFRGKLMLVMFGFTSCPDVCPLQLQAVAAALECLDPKTAAMVAPIFITVDPRNDTPARVGEFVRAFHPEVTGLTGTDEAVGTVVREYRVHVLHATNGDPAMTSHSSFMYLMGPDGGFLSLIMPNATGEEIAARLAKYAS